MANERTGVRQLDVELGEVVTDDALHVLEHDLLVGSAVEGDGPRDADEGTSCRR